ncbi:hypothetical protein NE865_14060 [Phthorimaea operculella]|nr:hypothetical protein NE865_14060 [Phthorimaea operculella]
MAPDEPEKKKKTPTYSDTGVLIMPDDYFSDSDVESDDTSVAKNPVTIYKEKILNLTKEIKAKLTEGKSLTKANKNTILQLLIDVQDATTSHCIECAGSSKPSDTPSSTALDRATIAVIKDTIKEEVAKIQKTIESKPSYSSILKNTPSAKPKKVKIPTTKPAIIISPTKEVFSSAEMHEIVKKNITFKDTNFAPANIRYVSNNKISMEFDEPEQVETTLKKIHESNCPIKAEKSKKLKPMFILKGISKERATEELTELISRQNEAIKKAITSQEDLVFKFRRNNVKEDLYNAVFMTTPTIWRAAVAAGKVNIDHQRIHIEEYTPLLQCYKCLQFGHTRLRCTNENTICSHCSAMTHNFKDCPVKSDKSKVNCYNCDKHLKKHNSNLDVPNHAATSKDCPKVIQMTENLRTRIDYGQ